MEFFYFSPLQGRRLTSTICGCRLPLLYILVCFLLKSFYVFMCVLEVVDKAEGDEWQKKKYEQLKRLRVMLMSLLSTYTIGLKSPQNCELWESKWMNSMNSLSRNFSFIYFELFSLQKKPRVLNCWITNCCWGFLLCVFMPRFCWCLQQVSKTSFSFSTF